MVKILLTRDEFRKTVFNRDGHKCVICSRTDNLDAHHIIERRLFSDFGFYIQNGVTVCPEHHVEAEQTVLSCEELREAAGIQNTLLPGHLYSDMRYDKWGNPILPDGRRLKGELFFDASVQKILKSADILDIFCKYVKYPRTLHLPYSEGITKDDRVLKNTSIFRGKRVIVTEKMDGENCLDGDSILITTDGEKTIKEICDEELDVKVLSYNQEDEEAEFKEIEGYSILSTDVKDEWYEIETEEGQILRLTSEHRVFLPDLGCYRKVKDLDGNENILLKK